MEDLVGYIQNEFITKKEFPEFSAGDTLTVYYQVWQKPLPYEKCRER